MKALVSPAQAPPARRRRRTPRSPRFCAFPPRRYAAATVSAVSGRPCNASGGPRKDARGMSIIGLSMAALPCGAKEDVEAGSAALRVDWPVYPRRAEHNTVAEGGNRRLAEMDVAVVTVEGGLAKLPRARAFHRDSQDYVTKALPAPAWRAAGPPSGPTRSTFRPALRL